MTVRFEILTIFPEFFRGFFEHGVVSRAQKAGRIGIGVRDLRSFTHDRHRTVDDRPFGGGEGMVLKAEPLAEALGSLGIVPVGGRRWCCFRRRDDRLRKRWRGSWPGWNGWC
jgi:tRNA (guanine37-N1)-methyltransferase